MLSVCRFLRVFWYQGRLLHTASCCSPTLVVSDSDDSCYESSSFPGNSPLLDDRSCRFPVFDEFTGAKGRFLNLLVFVIDKNNAHTTVVSVSDCSCSKLSSFSDTEKKLMIISSAASGNKSVCNRPEVTFL